MSSDLTAFEASLRKGSGRAALMLRSDPSNQELQAAILEACKTVQAYDAQCESGRAPYLWRLIALTGRSDYFWRTLLDSLDHFDQADNARNIVQIHGVLCLLAPERSGLEQRRLHEFIQSEAVRKAGFLDVAHPCGEDLIRLEGLGAFLVLIGLYFIELLNNIQEQNGWAYRAWLEALRAKEGDAATAAALTEARSSHAELDRLMSYDTVEDQRAGPHAAVRRDAEEASGYTAIKASLDPKKGFPRLWIKSASADELFSAASDLLLETDEARIHAYLRIFVTRDYPLNPETLFPIVESENRRSSWHAIRVLRRLHDHRVRNFAFELLESGREIPGAVLLLCSNYMPGDFVAIERAVRDVRFDDDGWHSLGTSVLNLLASAPVPPNETRDMLLALYEKTPCSLCREQIVRRLHDHDLVPGWMARECEFDADPETASIFETP